jgi:hypothetical protein
VRSKTYATERAVLGSLANVVYERPAQREVELWRVTKAHRELRCLAIYLPTGIDLKPIGCRFPADAAVPGWADDAKSEEWRRKLIESG